MKYLILGFSFLIFIGCTKENKQENIDQNTVQDYDGNVYHSVTIGSQVWMKENLRTTHYRNGDAVTYITDNDTWGGLTTEAYCDYLNNPDNANIFGRLYNWFAAKDSRSLAPAGWHIATDADWETLVTYLGGTDVAGGKMKDTLLNSWPLQNTGATNESGFSAVATGYRHFSTGEFSTILSAAWFWSSTDHDDYYYRMNPTLHDYSDELIINTSHPSFGYSCRCVKD